MKKSTKIALSLVVSTILFTGCGGGGSASENVTSNPSTSVEKNAKAQLGVLSQAMVKIFELGTSPRKLIATEITTSGSTIEEIGNFNAHEDELNDDKFYLYEVHGGKDMDANDDGIVDSIPAINNGIFRAVVKGSDVKSIGGKFKVTAVSEIQYKKVEDYIDNTAVLREKLKNAPKLIIKDDINQDGVIDGKDIMLYNPVKHEDKLEKVYKDKMASFLEDIHKKDKEIDVSTPPIIKGNTFVISENATTGNKVGQVTVIDDGQAPITSFSLKGEGSSKFTIDKKGAIRVNTLSVLSLKTLKTYNLKVVATNRVGSSNEADVKINVRELDKVAPVFGKEDSFSVAESASFSQFINVSDDSTITFSLEGDDSEFFKFDDTTKKLSLNQTLDFEKPKDENGDNTYNVSIKATDIAGNSATKDINVTIKNVADVVPVMGDGGFALTSTKVGATVGTVVAKNNGDSEITSYKLSGEGSELFAISTSGVITVKSEKLSTAKETTYNIKVSATNKAGESNTALISINFKDITKPVFAQEKSVSVAENKEFKLQLEATDNTQITYTIDGGSDKGMFDITSDGVLSFNGAANFEEPSDSNKDNSYEVRVKAEDSAKNSSYQNITVKVTDVADVKPVLKDTTFEIAENFSKKILGKVKIENQGDRDITSFSLTGTGSENFSIDSDGTITLNNGVTLVKNNNFTLQVNATSEAGESNSATVTIRVTEKEIISLLSDLEVEVPEGTKKAVQLGAESLIGADPIIFSLDRYAGDSNLFVLDQYNNLIFKDTTDFENPSDTYYYSLDGEIREDNTYRVIIKIKDAKDNEVSKVLHVKVTNVPDVKPTITNTKLAISGTVLPNTVVGNVKIDQGDSEVTEMSLSGTDANLFSIDKDGVIKTAKKIPAEKNSISLKVKATSPAGISDEKVVTVNINDTDPDVRGIAQLGLEKNATVNIYQIMKDGTYKKRWTETTSDGDIGSAGRFNTHSTELEDKEFYIYQVTGGEDIDANNDGIEDENSTTTKGAMRAVVRGEWLKAMNDDAFKITALSEMHYVNSVDAIKNNYMGLVGALATNAKELLSIDLNSDGNIDGKDILLFDPLVDKEAYTIYDRVARDIHLGIDNYSIIDAENIKVGEIALENKASSFTLSKDEKKLYLKDNGFMKIYDVSDVKKPKLLGKIETSDHTSIALSDDGKYAYIGGKYDTDKGLKVFNISDPSNIQLVKSLDDLEGVHHLKLSKNNKKLYLIDTDFGHYSAIKVFDVSDPINTAYEKTLYNHAVEEFVISKDESKMYAINYLGTLVTIDLTGNEENKVTPRYSDNARFLSMGISKDEKTLYITDAYSRGIISVDISKPFDKIAEIGFLSTYYNPAQLTVQDNNSKIFARAGRHMYIIDSIDPKNLIKLVDTPISDDASYIHTKDGKTMFYSDSNTLKVYQFTQRDAAAPIE